ncbi:MAG: PD-(D/E)XK nuclease family protein [Defluviitaleaceae bacterium]|nr:PD-(D/E)XK nuclease family protein [Defluviitaleaceae bacterium]
MPLQFIPGPPGSGKTAHCLKEIERFHTQPPSGNTPLYYLVPEQFSLQSERLLLTKRAATVRVQVLSFNRLAYRLFSAMGGPPGRIADELAKAMILRKVLFENADAFVYYQSAHDKQGFIDTLAKTLTELNHYRVTAEDLLLRVTGGSGIVGGLGIAGAPETRKGRDSAPLSAKSVAGIPPLTRHDVPEMPGDPALSAKLSDLSLILTKYREAVDGRYLLTDDLLDLLAQRLEVTEGALPLLDGAHIWVDGFSGFTPQERLVLLYIMKRAAYMGVTLTTRDTQRFIDPLCETPRTTQEKLSHAAIQAGIELLPLIYMEDNFRHAHNPGMAFFVAHFTPTAGVGKAKIYNAGNEGAFAAGAVSMREGGDSGDRLRLQGSGIPSLPHSRQQPFNPTPPPTHVINNPPIELIPARDPYDAVLSAASRIREWVRTRGYRFNDIAVLCGDRTRYEGILRLTFDRLRIPLFVDTETDILSHPLTELIRAAFEIINRNYSMDGIFRFLKTGLVGLPQDDVDILENHAMAHGINGYRWRYEMANPIAEAARRHMMRVLVDFERVKRKSTVETVCRKVFDLLYALDVPGTLSRWFDERMADGDPETARIHKQVWPKICEVFDKLAEILGGTTVTPFEFASLLDAGFAQVGLGRIPPTLDQVVLGDMGRSRYPEVKAMIVLGANEGVLPPLPAAQGLFTDDERERLRNSDLELAPDIANRANEQYYALYCALSQPADTLAFIYAESEPGGKVIRPSPILRAIRVQFPMVLPKAAAPIREYTSFTPTQIERKLPMLSPASVNRLFGPVIYTAASRLEAYARCPFAYYMTYLLKAKPRKRYEIMPADLGSLFHDVVASFARRYRWQPRTKAEIKDIVGSIVKELVPENEGSDATVYHGSARNRYILDKAQRVCTASVWALNEYIRQGEYTPAYTEIDLPPAPPVPLDNGRSLSLSGRIDRADLLDAKNGDTYVRIIDYKSGHARFNPNEVRNGTQLQLMLYLNAMLKSPELQHKNPKPGGVFYFPIDDPLLRTDHLLDDIAREAGLLKAFKMSGADFTDANSFDDLNRDANEKMKDLTLRLTEGIIAPAPCISGGKTPCDYCKYGAACKHGFGGY